NAPARGCQPAPRTPAPAAESAGVVQAYRANEEGPHDAGPGNSSGCEGIPSGSERDVVIREPVVRRRRRLALRRLPLRRGLLARARHALAATATATFAPAAEHLHLAGDDLGEELLDPVLAGVLVVSDFAFHVDLRALAQVLAGELAELAEEGHAVPLRVLLRIAVAVLADAGGRQADLGDGHATLGVLGFRVVAEISDQDGLVDAACHG